VMNARKDSLQNWLRCSRLLGQIANISNMFVPSRKFWTWGLYGLGFALKSNLGLPQRQRLKLGSDHGVSLSTSPSRAEKAMESSIFITWSKWRAENMKFSDGRTVLQVQHPWVPFRKANNIILSKEPAGTLVFVPHSVPGIPSPALNLNAYITFINSLPKEFHPLTFCLHFNDMRRGLDKDIKKRGFRVTTAGNTLHPRFANRFYSILRDFEYATSPTIGSQLFYAHELGVKYFIHDYQVKARGEELVDAGDAAWLKTLVARIEEAFSRDKLNLYSAIKDDIVRDALGLDIEISRLYGYGPIQTFLASE